MNENLWFINSSEPAIPLTEEQFKKNMHDVKLLESKVWERIRNTTKTD